MAIVEVTRVQHGFWVVKTGDGEANVARSHECRDESELMAVLRGWGVTDAASQTALLDLRKNGRASFGLP